MPWREQPADQVWPPPGPIPRRMPDGRLLVRRMKMTEEGPVPNGYAVLSPTDDGFPAWDSLLRSRGQ